MVGRLSLFWRIKMTVRADMLREKYNAMIEKKMISIGDIDDLMDQVDKLLQNYWQTVESRDKWKAKYEELKKNGV